MNKMRIHQEWFKTLKDFDQNPKYRKGSNNSGVYMWGFSLEKNDYSVPSNSNMFFPFYVGKVEKQNGCLYNRTQEHLGTIMGGNSSIFDFATLSTLSTIIPIGSIHSNYQKISEKAKKTGGIGPCLPDSDFPYLLHFPEGVHRMLHFTNDPTIKAQIDWMLRHFCITYFRLEHYNKQDVKELEKFIGNLVGYKRLITIPYSNPNLNVEIIDTKSIIDVKLYDDLFKH